MSKFYPHHVEDCIRQDKAWEAAADKVGESLTTPWMVERQILHLQHIAENGLPDCYEDFEEFLYDFYPGFAWGDPDREEQIKAVLADARFAAIAEAIQRDWDFDLRADLVKAITEKCPE